MSDGALLLDTHALIWLQVGRLSKDIGDLLLAAAVREELFVSTASAWEIGLLHRKGLKGGKAPAFSPDPQTWYARAVAAPGLTETPISATIAISASLLPEPLHGDPGDRLLIATARHLGAALVTRDRAILDYAALGHVHAVAC